MSLAICHGSSNPICVLSDVGRGWRIDPQYAEGETTICYILKKLIEAAALEQRKRYATWPTRKVSIRAAFVLKF